MANNFKEESGPPPPPSDRWINLTLGSSFKDDHPTSKFCTLRYEFKPASIDKNQPGRLHKSKDNKVTVDFHNNQSGKPNVHFEGIGEDYKDNDAVLFYDGETIRLERLHRAVKRLRHVRQPGEAAAAAGSSSVGLPLESNSSPAGKVPKLQSLNKSPLHLLPAEVDRIEIGDFKIYDAKPKDEKPVYHQSTPPNPSYPSPDNKNDDLEEELDILNNDDDDEDISVAHNRVNTIEKEIFTGIDINMPHQNDMDDEIAEVDIDDDDEAERGPNAAEALRAQVNAEERKEQSSSSSGSGSGSSESGSSSSSSENESSDDSINSI